MNAADALQAIRTHDSNLDSLLDQLADVNITDEDGQSMLHEAVSYHNPNAAAVLIARGIDVNGCDRNGQTPLHYAGIHQDSELARLILSNGGDMSIADIHGNTPLWSAVFHAKGHYDTIRVFAEFGCRGLVAKANKHGKSPLDFANQIGDTTLARIITSH